MGEGIKHISRRFEEVAEEKKKSQLVSCKVRCNRERKRSLATFVRWVKRLRLKNNFSCLSRSSAFELRRGDKSNVETTGRARSEVWDQNMPPSTALPCRGGLIL